jgi:hypothetical protein
MKCAHCGDPNPGVLHLFAGGPSPALRVGSLVMAKKTTGVCDVGEVGVVYEEHRLYDRAGWGIIFESGRHNGLNACEVEWFLTVTGETCEWLQGYAFENVRRLVEDFDRGLFAPAFNTVSARVAAGTTGGGDGTPAAVNGPRSTERP